MRRLAAVAVLAGCSAGSTSQSARTPAPASAAPARGTRAEVIAVGGDRACFVAHGGGVVCWGGGNPTPTPVAGVPLAVAIALGEEHACVLTVDKTVWCWGDPSHGATARASGSDPAAVAIEDVVEIGAGDHATCARLANGSVSCWGTLAHEGTLVTTPRQVIARDAIDLEVGGQHACARLRGGAVRCWGQGEMLAQGNGNYDTQESPIRVADAGDGTLTCRGGHCCVLGSSGLLTCWGFVPAGPMIQGSFVITKDATPFTWLDAITTLWAGERYDCGARYDGSIVCWGDDPSGCDSADQSPAPIGTGTAVCEMPELANSRALAITRSFGCALSSSGTVSCWGADTAGQLGDGTISNGRSKPAPIAWSANDANSVPATPRNDARAADPSAYAALGTSCKTQKDCPSYAECYPVTDWSDDGIGAPAYPVKACEIPCTFRACPAGLTCIPPGDPRSGGLDARICLPDR